MLKLSKLGVVSIKAKVFDNEYLTFFCSEFADILRAGMSVSEGFLLLSEREDDPRAKAILDGLYESSLAGSSAAETMRECGAFPEYLLLMVETGERTGYLERVFRSLSAYYDKQTAISRTVKSAVGYPALLFVIMLIVFFVFVCEVLPIFNDVFARLGAVMSPAAVAFMNFGLAVARARWVLLGLAAAIVAAALLIRFIPAWRERFGLFRGRLVSRTRIAKRATTARFASSLALAYSGLADMDDSLALAQRFCDSPELVARVEAARERIASGGAVADSISELGIFNSMYCRMISIGLKTGSLESALDEIARRSSGELDSAIDRFTSRVEPVTVVVLSVLVGLLLLSVMLPLVGVMSAM